MRTRRQGWAINRGELFAEAGALAVPILDARGACVAALGLNIPLSRLTEDRVRTLVSELRSATDRLRPTLDLGIRIAVSEASLVVAPADRD